MTAERPVVVRKNGERQGDTPKDPNGTDAESTARPFLTWSDITQIATIGVFVILSIAALELGRPLLLPVVSAFVIGFMLGPLSARAVRSGIPDLVTAIVLWLLVIGIFYVIIIAVTAPVVDLIGKAPEIGQNIKDKLHLLDRPIAAFQDLRNAIFPPGRGEPEFRFDLLSIAQPAFTFVTPALGQIVVFLGTLFFFLLGRAQFRQVLVVFFEERDARLRTLKILNDIEHNLTGYLSVVALINLAVGLAAGIIAYAVGLPNAAAWGMLAFVLNFIPYIGALIMQLILFFVGLVTFQTVGHALIAPLLYLAFTTLEGHFVTPSIMGKRLFLNPLTVFLSLVFWTWLWGPIGAFLAVPLLIMTLVVFNHLFPEEESVLPG